MGMIINPFMVASAAVATTKVQVRLAEFDSDDGCACSLNEYEVWENDSNDHSYPGGDLTLAVDDWISGDGSDGSIHCAQVTALNASGTAEGATYYEYTDCSDCNDNEMLCEAMDPGGDGPGGP